MKIIPAIDIIDGKCVRLTQGDYTQKKIYHDNPADMAKAFQDAGLQYLHVVDLDGAKAGKVINWKALQQITRATTLSVDFGGGIKTTEEIQQALDLGIKQVNLGSIAVKAPDKVVEWLGKFGSDKVILSADVRDEKILINGWQNNAEIPIIFFLKDYMQKGIEYVACTDINTDGMLSGPNLELYKKIMLAFPTFHLTASGGVRSLEDIRELRRIGVDGVIVGKAIYEEKITLKELETV
jgi:phosphoribosylformimino-5-aminoimidazole carboxamide ribotide isomerase